ncbi:MAG: hypothetical protein GY838_17115 [bacterium]|nr:hypothetical protein [bacterium]
MSEAITPRRWRPTPVGLISGALVGLGLGLGIHDGSFVLLDLKRVAVEPLANARGLAAILYLGPLISAGLAFLQRDEDDDDGTEPLRGEPIA